MASQSSSAQNAQPRLSRYRSQRRSQQSTTETIPTVPQLSSTINDTLERTKTVSRYHRSPPKPAHTDTPTKPQPHVPSSPAHSNKSDTVTRSNTVQAPRYHHTKHRAPLPGPPPPAIAPRATHSNHSRDQSVKTDGTSTSTSTARQAQVAVSPRGKEQARAILEREDKRQRRMRKQQEEATRSKKLEVELQRAEEDRKRQKQEEEEKAQKLREWEEEELRRAAKDEEKSRGEKKKAERAKRKEKEKLDKIVAKAKAVDEPSRDLFSFLRRRKTGDMSPTSTQPDLQRPKTSSGEKAIIKPGGGGIVPLSDAPVSAVNHGDRRVRVVTQGKSILLPVKPTTTPLQLVRSSVTFFDVPIDPRNSLLMENFTKVGLQRTLRMYESVRNVLNSWDSDDQHTLTLTPYDSSQDRTLYAAGAPKSRPTGGSWTMYFSQKRGKWDKRVITMTEEGQISVAKNEQGKDSMNVCHLSDFEVYSLSKEGEKKKIKPPKKYCYAIKSNQKSSMFLGDTGFIHLFCSNDQSVASHFYDTVYRWRCWYLVHIMGEDGEKNPVMDNLAASSSAPLLSTSTPSGHKRRSSKASQYILGSFNTNIDFNPSTFEMREEMPKPHHKRMGSDEPLAGAIGVSATNGLPSAIEHSKALHARQRSIRRAAVTNPLPAAQSKSRSNSNTTSHTSSTPSTSAALQRTSSVRSNTNRRSLDRSLDRSSSTRHPGTSTAAAATAAAAVPLFPKPLIDLTPQYATPVQHQRKGRGFKPASGPLIANATGLEPLPGAIVIPEAREWRPRGASVGQQQQQQQQQPLPQQQQPQPQQVVAAMANVGIARNSSVRSVMRESRGQGRGLIGDIAGDAAFTGGGLLASQRLAGGGAAR